MKLANRPEPKIGPDDVLVEIAAASINPIDWKIRKGQTKAILKYKMPLILGNDFAGRVIKAGKNVKDYAPGDDVYGRPPILRIGTFAERIALPHDSIAPMPKGLDYAQAASVPLAALTAWQALVDVANLQKGQKVLIHAGAGGVGVFAIQIAKSLGADIATTASANKHDMLRALGAKTLIDYHQQDFANALKNYDVVLDAIGGDTLMRSLGIVRKGGIVVSLSGPPDQAFAKQFKLGWIVRFALAMMSKKVRKAARRYGVRYQYLFMHDSGAQLAMLAKLIEDGAVKPVLDRQFDFTQTDQAIAYAEKSHASGKVIITRNIQGHDLKR